MSLIVYHNPACGTSRNVLKFIELSGQAHEVVEYLQAGWTRSQLETLFAAAGVTPREALRIKKSPAAELGLLDTGVGDDALLDAMCQHPVLVNRPFVVSAKGSRLCRPSEQVLDLLECLPPGPLFKEDGQMIVDAQGRRVGS
jgi:arsenate reductase